MHFVEPLFLSDNIHSEEKIKRKLSCRAGVAGLYLVCLSDRDDELFVLYPDEEFMHEPFRNSDVTVVGLARGYITAKHLVKRIVEEIIESEGTVEKASVKAYFASRTGEGSL
ncbi:MAG: hypothetical protein VZQ80_01305 [Lachnospiraceae bacterium]|nr:hypothetical protein [Lachnospiraceae bacterium]